MRGGREREEGNLRGRGGRRPLFFDDICSGVSGHAAAYFFFFLPSSSSDGRKRLTFRLVRHIRLSPENTSEGNVPFKFCRVH